MDDWAVAQAVAAAVLGALPVRALLDAFLLGVRAGLLGVAAAALVVLARGAAPASAGAVGGLRLLHRLGDRPALVRAYQDLKAWLRVALTDPDEPPGAGGPGEDASSYAPDPETARLYRQLLADLEGRAAARAAD